MYKEIKKIIQKGKFKSIKDLSRHSPEYNRRKIQEMCCYLEGLMNQHDYEVVFQKKGFYYIPVPIMETRKITEQYSLNIQEAAKAIELYVKNKINENAKI